MRRLFLVPLFVLCMADDCDPPAPKPGTKGMDCYANGSCDGGLTCIQWKNHKGEQKSICAAPQDIVVGAVELVQCDANCPKQECPKQECPTPKIHLSELRCPPVPPPVHCPPPVKCPLLPAGPCPEIKACEPGWHR